MEIKENPNGCDHLTLDLLQDIQNNLTEVSNEIENSSNATDGDDDESNFLLDVNTEQFQFQNFLVCRHCNVSI